MSKTRGIVFEAEVSRDVQPGVVTLYDQSRFANNGVITGVTWTQLPSGLWSLTYDSVTELITVADSLSIRLTTAFTFELWTYRASLGENSTPYMISKNTLTDYGMIYWSDDSIRFYPGAQVVAPAATLVLNVWQYIALTFDVFAGANELQCYLNGAFVGQGTRNTVLATSANALILGNRAAADRTFDGYIALLRIHNYALTAGQILQRFEAERSLFGV